ncbi:MAG: hypothetical protein ACRELB_24365, partial [Polyangiaceae bacterium]
MHFVTTVGALTRQGRLGELLAELTVGLTGLVFATKRPESLGFHGELLGSELVGRQQPCSVDGSKRGAGIAPHEGAPGFGDEHRLA